MAPTKQKIVRIFIIAFIMLSCLFLYDALVRRPRLLPPGWFPFVLENELSASSPADAGKLVLDAPAGKHGFLKTEEGHFYFQDGTPARFWGTNLCFSACFPSKKQAKTLARRLAFFGFNAVRLHHMDSSFEPEGIFKDTCPRCRNPQDKKTGILSKKQLNRLDYLIYELKKKGIYVDMNLLVSRRFTRADGVSEAERLKSAAKPASMFDPKLIELQQQFAKALLSHYNPYTKRRTADDPAVALIEITNENSMFRPEKSPLPDFYRGRLDALWKGYLKDNQAAVSKTKKAFLSNVERLYIDRMLDFLKKECHVKVPITGIGGYADKENLISLSKCDFIDTHAYWAHPGFPRRSWDKEDFRMHNKSALLDRDLGITGEILGRAPDNKKPYTVSEWGHCYPNEYAYETPVLLAYEAVRQGWDGLFQFAYSHNQDLYAAPGSIQNYFDTAANPQQLILGALASSIFRRNNDSYKASVSDGILRLESPHASGAVGFIKNKEIDQEIFAFSSDEDGAVFLYAPKNPSLKETDRIVLITVGAVKNKASGWEKGKFLWGKTPTLLKKMNVRVAVHLAKKFRVYALDGKGRRKKRIKTYLQDGQLIFSTKNTDTCWFELSAS